jgi:nitroreductase
MNTMDAILTRRSIRRFKTEKVPQEMIDKLLKAAMAAPSAGNEQPWQFIIINDEKIMKKIPAVSPYAAYAKDAPAAILVCGDTRLEMMKGFWVQDCCAAIQNILLAAQDMGLGAVWTAAYSLMDRVAGFQKLLNIPAEVIPLAFIPIGYPAEEKQPEDRFKKERVHLNTWQG